MAWIPDNDLGNDDPPRTRRSRRDIPCELYQSLAVEPVGEDRTHQCHTHNDYPEHLPVIPLSFPGLDCKIHAENARYESERKENNGDYREALHNQVELVA